MQTLKRESDDKKFSVALFGIQPDSFLAPKISDGANIQVTKPDEIVVDSSLKSDGIKIGDVLMDDILNRELTVVGFTENQKYSHAPVVYINIATWQEINPVYITKRFRKQVLLRLKQKILIKV